MLFDNNAVMDDKPDRPLLSRVADSMFWMARYVERAEQVARLMKVNTALLMDVGDLAPALQARQWQSVLEAARVAEPDPVAGESFTQTISRYMAFDALNPASIITSLSRARENARAVRSEISAEMWKAINSVYLFIRSPDAKIQHEEQSEEFYESIMNSAMQFVGIADNTLTLDQRWHFIRLGRAFERADMTCRIVDSRFVALADPQFLLESPLRNIQWMNVLRMCCSIEAYRRMHTGDLDPINVAAFVVFERDFPRSVFQNVREALASIRSIRQLTSPRSLDPAERVLGVLNAQLEFADPGSFTKETVSEFVRSIRTLINEASNLVTQTYFRK
jgi:uncharacterized alpha-E superfamily protein